MFPERFNGASKKISHDLEKHFFGCILLVHFSAPSGSPRLRRHQKRYFGGISKKMADLEGFKTFSLKSWKVSQTSQRFQTL